MGAAEECGGVRGGIGFEVCGFDFGEDEAVDVIAGPRGVFDGGRGVFFRGDEGPVGLVFGSLFDPAFEDGAFGIGERTVEFGWWHDLIGIMAVHASDHCAFADVAGDDGAVAAFEFCGCAFEGIEAEAGFAAFVGVGSVAGEAAVGENGADVAVEVDFFR